MSTQAGARVSRRRFLALSAGGATAGAAALSGRALQVSSGVSGAGETVTLMINQDDLAPELIRQAHKDLGIKIVTVRYDITKLIAMLTNGNPPDLVRGIAAVDAPYFAAWFFGEAPAKGRASGGWGIPTLKSLRPLMPAKEEYQKRVLKVQEAELKHFSVASFTPYAKWEGLEALFNQIAPAAMKGHMSVETLAGQLNSAMNEQLKRGKERVTLSSAWVGFGFARLSAPGKKTLFGILLGSRMLPQLITLFPTYLIFAELGMVDTYWPWVLWGLSGAPYLVFLFRQFLAGLPREREEAAIVDGCGYPRIFWQIFLPQSWPVSSASFVIAFTWSWGDYIAPQPLLSTGHSTLAVAVMSTYVNGAGAPVANLRAAASAMYVVTILFVFLVAQCGFVSGMATSGLK